MEKLTSPVKRINDETRIIGRNLLHLRQDCGASQRQVAEIIQTSFQQVQKYEKGQNRIPAEKLYRLKHFFCVPYGAFFEGLPDRSDDGVHVSEKNAKMIYAKMKKIKDGNFQRKLFKAFMILAS